MILACLLLLATIISTWFCYWFLRSFPQLWNRASRIATLVCPWIFALIFAVSAGTLLGRSGIDIDFSSARAGGRAIGALVLGLAVSLTLPTLAIAWAVGNQYSKSTHKASPK